MKARIQSESGFSLIELMIVVAIIGILATIAIPNFQKFTNKAKQSEVKAALGSIFTAEMAFQAEWNQFYTDFRDIGYAPNGQMNYLVGFGTAAATTPGAPFVNSLTGGNGADTCINNGVGTTVCGWSSLTFLDSQTAFLAPGGTTNYTATGTGTAATFLAGGESSVITAVTTTDEWTMNQSNLLQNVSSGI